MFINYKLHNLGPRKKCFRLSPAAPNVASRGVAFARFPQTPGSSGPALPPPEAAIWGLPRLQWGRNYPIPVGDYQHNIFELPKFITSIWYCQQSHTCPCSSNLHICFNTNAFFPCVLSVKHIFRLQVLIFIGNKIEPVYMDSEKRVEIGKTPKKC